MRFYSGLAVLLLALGGLVGCHGQKGAKLQTSVIPPDKTLFQNGSDLLEKSRFTEARLLFQTLVRTYPGSDLEAEAYLKWGDSYYNEGGTENMLMAEDQYKNFIIFFPTNPKAADAQMKIIAIRMREMNAPDRDQHNAQAAQVEINRFLQMFPQSDYVPVAKKYLDLVNESLAIHSMDIGDFYAGRGSFGGAITRYREVTEQFPHFSRLDEANFKLAQLLERVGNKEDAAKYLDAVAVGYPFSKYYADAKSELEKLGKTVPAVDDQLSAQHQALVKAPEGFSPLRPFIDFAEAIGFKGAPDRYDQAQKIVAANKAQAAAAAASAAGNKPGDVLINATIEKGPDGKAVVKPNAADKKDDKKQDVIKKDDQKQDDKPIKK
ncbi:MAG: outer membrane protein assembly factor BamD [Acidobacteriota bacterium]|jgi:outer membrane assembly lipoprotein YfiO